MRMHGTRRDCVRLDAEDATSLAGLTYRAQTETLRLHEMDLLPSDGLDSHAPLSRCAGQPDPERGLENPAVYRREAVIQSLLV